MTKKDLDKLPVKNLQNNQTPMIAIETDLKALGKLTETAAKNIAQALAGDLATHIYGSPRLTKDVDVIASGILDLDQDKNLGFGGKRYAV